MNSEQVLEKLKEMGKISDEDINDARFASDEMDKIVEHFHLFLCPFDHDNNDCKWYENVEVRTEWLQKVRILSTELNLDVNALNSVVNMLKRSEGVVDIRKLLPVLCSIFLNFGPEVLTEHTASSSND